VKRRQILLIAVLLLATLFLATQLNRLEDFARILSAGHPVWIGLGALLVLVWQVAQAAQFRAAHRAAGVQQSLLSMLPVVAANNFVLIALPSANLSTIALFMANARRQGASPERTLVAVVTFAVFQYLALSTSVALALLALAVSGALYPLEWLPALPIFAIALVQYAVFLLALRWPARLERAALWLAERLNRLSRRVLRRELIALQRVHQAVANAAGGLESIRQNGARAQLILFVYGLLSQALLAIVLAVLLRAFGQHAYPATVLAGLGMAGLYTVVSPTPLGLGVVEGAVAVVLATLGLDAGAGLIVSLAFRGLTLWLPVLYGFVALETLGFRAIRPDPSKNESVAAGNS